MTKLAEEYLDLIYHSWRHVFSQQRTLERAVDHSMGMVGILGRRTISRVLCALDCAEQDWSADYKLFSRSRWNEEMLFSAVFEEHLAR